MAIWEAQIETRTPGAEMQNVSDMAHYRFEQDESLKKSLTHSENAIKSL